MYYIYEELYPFNGGEHVNTINDNLFRKIIKESLGALIHKIDRSIYLKHNNMLKKYGITFRQSVVLSFLYHNRDNESINQKTIEEYMEVTGPSVTSIIQNMVKNDIITHRQDENDGRNYRFELTKKGMELQGIGTNIFRTINNILYQDLSEDEIETLKYLLTKVVKNMED